MTEGRQIRLQLGTEADFARLAEIELAAARLGPPGRVPDLGNTVPTAQLQLGVQAALLWVARQQEVVVGFTMCTRHKEYLHLIEVAVHPDWGRQGVGRQLVGQVIEQARQLVLPGVTLTTFRDVAFNGPFYASMGFKEIPADRCSATITNIVAAEQAQGMVQRIGMLCLT